MKSLNPLSHQRGCAKSGLLGLLHACSTAASGSSSGKELKKDLAGFQGRHPRRP
jgi:hypothetical protein